MKAFLKGYYGYQNLGDEILFFGVAKYLFKYFQITKLYVEVGNIKRFRLWMRRNKDKIKDIYSKIKLIPNGEDFPDKDECLKVFGGGEVITDQRKFPYDGRNLFFKYKKDIKKGNFILLGGIGTPRKVKTRLLYKMVLPYAQRIIVRDESSFGIASTYNDNVVMYHDFAQDVSCRATKNTKKGEQKKVFLNINPYIYNYKSIDLIKKFITWHDDKAKIYIPYDMHQDLLYYDKLKDMIPDLQLYDWTKDDISTICKKIKSGTAGIGARLHFLLMLHWAGKDVVPLAYQEKVTRFFSKAEPS